MFLRIPEDDARHHLVNMDHVTHVTFTSHGAQAEVVIHLAGGKDLTVPNPAAELLRQLQELGPARQGHKASDL